MKKLVILGALLLFFCATFAVASGREEALDRIDWESINDGTIVLLTTKSNVFMNYISMLSPASWYIFVPSRQELEKFMKLYDFEMKIIGDGHKTLFLIEEKQKKNGSSPFIFQDPLLQAFFNLPYRHPSCFGGGGYYNPGSAAPQCDDESEFVCGNKCCKVWYDEECKIQNFCCEYGDGKASCCPQWSGCDGKPCCCDPVGGCVCGWEECGYLA